MEMNIKEDKKIFKAMCIINEKSFSEKYTQAYCALVAMKSYCDDIKDRTEKKLYIWEQRDYNDRTVAAHNAISKLKEIVAEAQEKGYYYSPMEYIRRFDIVDKLDKEYKEYIQIIEVK